MVVLTALMAVSCADWLDVQPSDQVSEETAFQFGGRFQADPERRICGVELGQPVRTCPQLRNDRGAGAAL